LLKEKASSSCFGISYHANVKIGRFIGDVWFGCFLFSFSLEIEDGDENVFG